MATQPALQWWIAECNHNQHTICLMTLPFYAFSEEDALFQLAKIEAPRLRELFGPFENLEAANEFMRAFLDGPSKALIAYYDSKRATRAAKEQ